jgi:hypothetical protein
MLLEFEGLVVVDPGDRRDKESDGSPDGSLAVRHRRLGLENC